MCLTSDLCVSNTNAVCYGNASKTIRPRYAKYYTAVDNEPRRQWTRAIGLKRNIHSLPRDSVSDKSFLHTQLPVRRGRWDRNKKWNPRGGPSVSRTVRNEKKILPNKYTNSTSTRRLCRTNVWLTNDGANTNRGHVQYVHKDDDGNTRASKCTAQTIRYGINYNT